mgnify:CR=1 FL=1
MQRRHAKRMTSLMLLIVFIAILIIGQSAKSTYAETATSSNINIPLNLGTFVKTKKLTMAYYH